MGDQIRRKISKKLLSKQNRRRYASVFAIVALLVCVGVAAVLRQRGVAMTHEETVLDCHYAGDGAHTHTSDCYDEYGNLVCPLEEKELHIHDDSCYVEESELVCGLEEDENHTHTDDCYETTRTLVCDQEEVTEEHVHGPGCFTTITVDDGDTMPAQKFTGTLKERDEDDNEHVVLVVEANAPQGALPEESSMTADFLKKEDTEDIVELIEADANKDNPADATTRLAVKNMMGVRVNFTDAEGEDILVTSEDVQLRVSTALAQTAEHPKVARVLYDTETKEPLSAELLDKVSLVNQDPEDTSTGEENTLQFKTDASAAYVVVELEEVEVTPEDEQQPAEGETDPADEGEGENEGDAEGEEDAVPMPAQNFEQSVYNKNDVEIMRVNVAAPEGAFPEGTTMEVTRVKSADVEDVVTEAVSEPDVRRGVTHIQAVDIVFRNAEGDEIEPKAKITVTMTADRIANEDTNAMLVHVTDEGSGELVSTLDEEQLGERELEASNDALVFDSGEFSIYAIAYTVDFHFDVDGEEFAYSIEGGSTITLTELLPLLGAVEAEEMEDFIAEVDTVEFSNPELVHVAQVEEDTTAGALKENLGLEPEYSARLTEEQIAEMDAKELVAPDWALVSLMAFDTEETLTITMKSGDVMVVKVTDLGEDPLGLNGYSFAIVNYRDNEWSALTDQYQGYKNHRGYYLLSEPVDVETENGVDYCDSDATVWKFEWIQGTSKYRIRNSEGKYLYIDPTIYSRDQMPYDQPHDHEHALRLEDNPGDGSDDDGTALTVFMYGGDYVIRNRSYLELANYSYGVYWLTNAGTDEGNNWTNVRLRLATPREDPTAPHKAQMIAAKDLQDQQTVVVYRKEWNSTDNKYDYYAIDGDGNLVPIWQSGDSVYWRGNPSIQWTLTEYTGADGQPNGYYELKNKADSNIVLAPQENSIVHNGVVGINLPGKENGQYSSRIGAWDTNANSTYGLNVENGQISTVSFLDSEEFSFATPDPVTTDTLTTVDTVNSTAKGITIKMYDFADGNNNLKGSARSYGRNSPQWMYDIMGFDRWNENVYPQGMVSNVLDTNGWPVSSITGTSLQQLFENGTYSDGGKDANNLFIQSVYDATGFYKYSAFENFAHYDESTGKFVVYEQVGTPNPGSTNYYWERGNFLPYNELDTSKKAQNLIDPDGNPLDENDPRRGETLYGLTETTDYFFGMTMEAKFTQNPGGLNDFGDPMVYEFNGDDDLWIFVDGVQILDIGGIHDAFRGSINFQTGLVLVRDGNDTVAGTNYDSSDINSRPVGKHNASYTYIKEQFWQAHRFPDGSPWTDKNDPAQDLYFTNGGVDDNGKLIGTFKDYSVHDFKMFYMERGAGASNLEMQFNLPVMQKNSFYVKKEMPQTQDGNIIQSQYADAAFYYTAHVVDEEGSHVYTRAQMEAHNGNEPIKYDDGTPVVWKTDAIFEVKPGQTAVIPVYDETVRYWVEEVEPEPGTSAVLPQFTIDNSDRDDSRADGTKTLEKTVKLRNKVVFKNKPREDIVNELRITKRVNGTPYNANDSFEYRIYLEDNTGALVPYYMGEYYQYDKDGKQVFIRGNQRVTAEVIENEAQDGTITYTYHYSNGTTETYDKLQITEHASPNGSIANIQDGDTIVIKGLFEGTDFLVMERLDRSYMSNDAVLDPDEQKYVWEGSEVHNAYVRSDESTKPDNFERAGHLFDEASDLQVVYANEDHTYENGLAARGTMVAEKDAEVLIKNRTNKPFQLKVKKKWTGIESTDPSLANGTVTVTLGRYALVNKAGTLNIVKTGVPTLENEVPQINYLVEKQEGSEWNAIGTYTFNGNEQVASIPLPVGTYRVTEVVGADLEGYTATHTPGGSQTITLAEDGQEETVTYGSTYTEQKGSLSIQAGYDGNAAGQVNFQNVTYKVYDKDGNEKGSYTYSQVQSGVTLSDLRPGTYRVVESAVPAPDNTVITRSPNNVAANAEASQYVEVTDGATTAVTYSTTYAQVVNDTKVKVNAYVLTSSGLNEAGSDPRYYVYATGTGKSMTEEFKPGTTVYVVMMVSGFGNGHRPDSWTNQDWTSNKIQTSESLSAANAATAYVQRTYVVPSSGELNIYYKDGWSDRGANVTVLRISETPFGSGNSTYSTNSLNSASPMMAPVSKESIASAKAIARANGISTSKVKKGQGIVTASAPADAQQNLPTPDDNTKKYVDDTEFHPTVELTQGEDGLWQEVLDELPATDAEGNLYYYYIKSVAETGMPKGTTPSIDLDGENQLMVHKNNYEDKDLSVTNTVVQTTTIDLYKVRADEDGKPTAQKLGGAKFYLTKHDEQTNGDDLMTNLVVKSKAEGNATINVDGTTGWFEVPEDGVTIEDLEPGTYTLVEAEAPDGYIITGSGWTFVVEPGELTGPDGIVAGLTITIHNTPGTALPESGGMGTTWIYLMGTACVAFGLVTSFAMRRRRERRSIM